MIPAPRRVLAAAVVVALLGTACGDVFKAGAAVVNGAGISKDVLAERVKALVPNNPEPGDDARREALRQLIQEELVRQEAAERGITVADEAVEERFGQARALFGSEAEFQDQLGQLGFTAASFRRVLRDQLVRELLAAELAGPITDEQVRQAYLGQREAFEESRIRHILFRVEDPANAQQSAAARRRAQQALTRIRGGERFADVARELSEDPSSKDAGGDLGFAPLSRYVPEFGAAVAEAKIGEVVGPVQTQFGFHLIVVLARRVKPLREVAEQVRGQLRSQQTETVIGRFLETELRSARVAVNPAYGDWDEETRTIVPHRSFVPASPEPDPDAPPGFLQLGG